jgi:hypothetical protein
MFKPYRLSGTIRRFIFKLLTKSGLTYSRQSNPLDLYGLFQKIWPVETGHELAYCGGSYIFPGEIGEIDAVFSPGVGLNSDFELQFAHQGVPCYLADASVSGPAASHENFNFIKKYIGSDGDGNHIKLDEWVSGNYPLGSNAVLQMDIEGAEYDAILSTPHEILNKFKVIVIEIHNLNFMTSQEGFILGSLFFDRLLKNFYVRHLHTNNYIRPFEFGAFKFPSDIELVLIRKDLCKISPLEPVKQLPHHLDRPSNPNKKDLEYYDGFVNGVVKRLI